MRERVKRVLESVLSRLIQFAIQHPGVKKGAGYWVRKQPRLHKRLRRFAVNRGILSPDQRDFFANGYPLATELLQLTPTARTIYWELKAAIEKNKATQR